MNHFVEELRKKPEHVRFRILYIASFGITGIIVLLWAGILTHKFISTPTDAKPSSQPFSLIKDGFQSTYKSVYNSKQN